MCVFWHPLSEYSLRSIARCWYADIVYLVFTCIFNINCRLRGLNTPIFGTTSTTRTSSNTYWSSGARKSLSKWATTCPACHQPQHHHPLYLYPHRPRHHHHKGQIRADQKAEKVTKRTAAKETVEKVNIVHRTVVMNIKQAVHMVIVPKKSHILHPHRSRLLSANMPLFGPLWLQGERLRRLVGPTWWTISN